MSAPSPTSSTVTARATAVAIAGLAVASLLTLVAVLAEGPTGLDRALSTWVAAHRSAGLIWLMEGVTVAGSSVAIWAVGLACVAWGFVRCNWRPLQFVIPTALAASLATNLMKLAIARPRPQPPIALRSFYGYSFPSGHATTAAALWGALAVAIVWSGRLRARVAFGVWAVVALMVGTSRIVLGAHWLTDVAAGTAVGTGIVAAAVLIATPASIPTASHEEPVPEAEAQPGALRS